MKRAILDGPMVFGAGLKTVVGVGFYGDLARRAGVRIPPFSAIYRGLTLTPRILHSEWIVDCLNPRCHGAEFWWSDENLFICSNCWNELYGGKWLRVTPPAQRKQVEAILRARPDRMNRNWFPVPWRDFRAESLADLRQENNEHGLPEEEIEEK